MRGFDRLRNWPDAELVKRYKEALSNQSNEINSIVKEDLLAEVKRRQLPLPCPYCGSTAVITVASAAPSESTAAVTVGFARYHCNSCGKEFD